MSVLCGRPTPGGPCRRTVTSPGGPCGANHTITATTTTTTAADATAAVAAPGHDPLSASAPDPPPLNKDRLEALGHAANPATPAHELERLAGHPDPTVRYRLTANPATPAHVLDRLAADPHWYILRGTEEARRAGAHRGRPDELGHTSIRIQVAANPSTAIETLNRLAVDRDPAVSVVARAAHPDTPAHELQRLAAGGPEWHYSQTIRRRVAQRPDCPDDALAALANDPDPAVRDAARSNPGFVGAVAAHAGLLTD